MMRKTLTGLVLTALLSGTFADAVHAGRKNRARDNGTWIAMRRVGGDPQYNLRDLEKAQTTLHFIESNPGCCHRAFRGNVGRAVKTILFLSAVGIIAGGAYGLSMLKDKGTPPSDDPFRGNGTGNSTGLSVLETASPPLSTTAAAPTTTTTINPLQGQLSEALRANGQFRSELTGLRSENRRFQQSLDKLRKQLEDNSQFHGRQRAQKETRLLAKISELEAKQKVSDEKIRSTEQRLQSSEDRVRELERQRQEQDEARQRANEDARQRQEQDEARQRANEAARQRQEQDEARQRADEAARQRQAKQPQPDTEDAGQKCAEDALKRFRDQSGWKDWPDGKVEAHVRSIFARPVRPEDCEHPVMQEITEICRKHSCEGATDGSKNTDSSIGLRVHVNPNPNSPLLPSRGGTNERSGALTKRHSECLKRSETTPSWVDHSKGIFEITNLGDVCNSKDRSVVKRCFGLSCLDQDIACAKANHGDFGMSLERAEQYARSLNNVLQQPEVFCVGTDAKLLISGCFGENCEDMLFRQCATNIGLREGVMHPFGWAEAMLPARHLSDQNLQNLCWTPAGHGLVENCRDVPCQSQEPPSNPVPFSQSNGNFRITFNLPNGLPHRFLPDIKKAKDMFESVVLGIDGRSDVWNLPINFETPGPLWGAGPARGGPDNYQISGLNQKTPYAAEGVVRLEQAHLDAYRLSEKLDAVVAHEVGHVILPLDSVIPGQPDNGQMVTRVKRPSDGQNFCLFTGPLTKAYYEGLLKVTGRNHLYTENDPRIGMQGTPCGCSGHPDRDILHQLEGGFNVLNNAHEGLYTSPSLLFMMMDRGLRVNWDAGQRYYSPELIENQRSFPDKEKLIWDIRGVNHPRA